MRDWAGLCGAESVLGGVCGKLGMCSWIVLGRVSSWDKYFVVQGKGRWKGPICVKTCWCFNTNDNKTDDEKDCVK